MDGKDDRGKFSAGNKLGKGRKPGALNVEKREIAVASREGFGVLHDKIMARFEKKNASVFAMIAYADLLAKRGWGVPPKKVNLPGDDRSPFAQLVEVMQTHENEKSESKGDGVASDEQAN